VLVGLVHLQHRPAEDHGGRGEDYKQRIDQSGLPALMKLPARTVFPPLIAVPLPAEQEWETKEGQRERTVKGIWRVWARFPAASVAETSAR
jgi:hypothetical protein